MTNLPARARNGRRRMHWPPRVVTSRRCGLLPNYFGHFFSRQLSTDSSLLKKNIVQSNFTKLTVCPTHTDTQTTLRATTAAITLLVKSMWLWVKYAGHQQLIGDPTYWVVVTTTMAMIRNSTVKWWFSLSIMSSSLKSFALNTFLMACISASICSRIKWTLYRQAHRVLTPLRHCASIQWTKNLCTSVYRMIILVPTPQVGRCNYSFLFTEMVE